MSAQNNIFTVDPKGEEYLAVAGGSYRILISGEQTNGAYAVIDMLVPPGRGPGPHAHKDMQEMFYILEGEVEFKREGAAYIAKKGSLVNIPLGGQVHCFKNKSGTNARLLCTVIPAGLDSFFREIGKPVEEGVFLAPPTLSTEELQKVKSISEKYGQELYPPDFLD